MAYVIKPKGERANFDTSCHRCQGELTINHGRVDNHDCRPHRPVTLAEIQAALDDR